MITETLGGAGWAIGCTAGFAAAKLLSFLATRRPRRHKPGRESLSRCSSSLLLRILCLLVAECWFRLSHKKAQKAQIREGKFESLIIVSAFVHRSEEHTSELQS